MVKMSPKRQKRQMFSGYIKKCFQFGAHISMQILLNIVGLLLLTILSVGLWSCMQELYSLRQSTNAASLVISKLTQNGYLTSDGYLNSDGFSDNIQKLGETNVLRDIRMKRDTSRPNMNYDPFRSTSREKEMEEYCWSLVYNKCTTSLPAGMPQFNEGPPGPPGPQGDKGEAGRSGHMGHMGPPGINGLKGAKGSDGIVGRIGVPGAVGARGPTGLPGVNGIMGSSGRRGRKGAPGPPGKNGPVGERGFQGFKGQKGERRLSSVLTDATNCTLFCTLLRRCSLKGEKGQRGLIGFEGYKGEKGEPGAKGNKGYGMQGFQGPQGPRGQKGDKGDRGLCSTPGCNEIPRNANYDRRPSEPRREMYSVPEGVTLAPLTLPTVPPSLAPRVSVCRVRQIGKPVFIRKDTAVYGSVMMDPINPGKIWLTRGHHGQHLEEYSSLEEFESWEIIKTYNLQYNRFYGTQHAMYNGSFYYHFIGKPYVVRYDLNLTDVAAAVKIRNSHFNDSQYVYKDSKSYYDISADPNGLWIIFSQTKRSGTHVHVMKLDLLTLVIVRIWQLPVDYGHHGNAFIACGIIYLIESPHEETTVVDYEYDFYTDVGVGANVELGIPFHMINMISFYDNVADITGSALLAWDNGYIIKYPMLL